MKKQQIQIAILFTVLAGLVAWYYGYEKKIRVDNENTAEKKKQLVSLSKDEIDELTIEKKGNPKITIKKTGQAWTLTQPIEDSADAPAINNILSTLTTTKHEDVVETDAKNLDKYGLKEPILTVVVKTPSKPNAENFEQVDFGSDTAVGNGVYFKTKSGGNSIYRVSNYIRNTFDKTAKDLRNHSVLDLSRSDLTEVEVQSSKGSFVIAKGDKDQWTLPREGLSTDNAETNKLLNGILDLKATDFAEEKAGLAAYGLQSPSLKIWLTKADKSKRALIGAKAKGKFFIKRDDKSTIFEIAADAFDKLEVQPASLRTKELAAINRFDIRRIKWERPGGKDNLELVRTEANQWEIPSEPKVAIDGTKVDSYLTTIQDTKLSAYGNKGKVAAPSLTVRLFEKKQNEEVESASLKFAAPKGGNVQTERSGLDLLFNIKEGDFVKLNMKRADFLKSEKPEEEPPKAGVVPEPKKS